MADSFAAPRTRVAMASQLRGRGIEIGAGHWPFPVPDAVTAVSYVSRHTPEGERALFPEVESAAGFARVDVIADLDHDGLRAFQDGSQDFVIASHVVEHLAAPIWGISEMLRVTRGGGHVLLVLPDRRRTFDRDRDGTTIEHLLREDAAGVREVDDLHIRGFLAATSGDLEPSRETIQLHRQRSVHVHCWSEDEFGALISTVRSRLQLPFRLVDRFGVDDPRGTGIEFGYLLQVSDRFGGDPDLVDLPRSESERLKDQEREIAALHQDLVRIYRSRTWRLGAVPRAVAARLRGR